MTTDVSALITALSNFGAFGVLVAFLIWKDIRSERSRDSLESKHKSEIVAMQERRIAYDRERLSLDKELAGALASLTSAIQSRK